MDTEFGRRLWHASIGLLICVLYYLQIPTQYVVLYFLLPVTVAYGSVDYYRLQDPRMNRNFVTSCPLRFILRKEEHAQLTTSFWFLVGAILTLWLFSRPVAALSLLYLAWCDPVAAWAGKKYGPKGKRAKGRFWNGKTHVGTAAAALVGVAITGAFLLCSSRPEGVSAASYAGRVAVTSLLGGLYAAGAELVEIGEWDDNLTMPIVSALLLSLLSPIGALYSHQI